MPPPLLLLSRRRRISPLLILFLVIISIWYLALPPDSPIVLAVRFNLGRLLHRNGGAARLPASLGRWPVHLPSEVGFLIKTGYGTRVRITEQLKALKGNGGGGGLLGDEGRDYIVVGDWTHSGRDVHVHDAVKAVLEKDGFGMGAGGDEGAGRAARGALATHPRLGKYRSLQGAVAAGHEEKALELGRKFGWELDALKFITGMEMAFRRMPHKKWYVILDDDTFIIKDTLRLLLSHLNHNKPLYLGNAVGDYRARFAHGGSGVVLSGAAMEALFSHEHVVAEAYVRSLDETWGDRLVATTLQQVGVYLDERYSHLFNGEAPEWTRVGPRSACSLVLSFHALREPGAMVRAATKLATVADRPVHRGELWALFGSKGRTTEADDHVGPGGDDEHVTIWGGVTDKEACRRKCKRWCFAWTYNADSQRCHASPWFVVGSRPSHPSAKASGVNWSAVRSALQKCSLPT